MSARAFAQSEFVRLDEPTERGGEPVGDLFAPARRLELVDVEIHGDRGTRVSHLSLDSDRVKAARARLPREAECLPEEKRKSWLYERWVGLTQADRDVFRAALDAADAPLTESTFA